MQSILASLVITCCDNAISHFLDTLNGNLQEQLANVVIVSSLGIFDFRNMSCNATMYGQEE